MVSPHLLQQELSNVMAPLSVRLMCCMELLRARKAVSSVYWNVWILDGRAGRSAAKRRYNRGDRDDSCGIPQWRKVGWDNVLLMVI